MNSWRLKRNTARIAERTLFERNFKGVLFFSFGATLCRTTNRMEDLIYD